MEKHYFNMDINSITRDWLKKLEWEKATTLFKNSDWIPEWDNIKIFQWIFSQNFKKWEKSRNWYKYDQNGWLVDNYARMPLILWQHDDWYGWIWLTQELWLDTKWNLQWLFFVDLDMLEDRNRKQVEKGFVKMVSTWAITLEAMFEDNETWKRYTREEAEDKFGWENIIKCLWGMRDSILTYVVTQAELVENSLVTIWSNFWAIAKSVNTLDNEMKTIAEQIKSEHDKNLFSKKSDMVKDVKNTVEEEKEVETTPETTETEENKVDSLKEVDTLKNEIASKDSEIESLKNSLSVKDTEINSLKDEVSKKETEINTLRDEAKEKVLANANVKKVVADESKDKAVNTVEDFTKKYGK